MDYIPLLPTYKRHGHAFKHVLVIVYKLIKIKYFIPTEILLILKLADIFGNKIYLLHGAPDNIISNRGNQFISNF